MVVMRKRGVQFHGTRTKEDGDFLKNATFVVETAIKLKNAMLKKGLRRARAKCPREGCGGTLHSVIAGSRNHVRVHCDNESCSIRMME